jgi:hypothetical protein
MAALRLLVTQEQNFCPFKTWHSRSAAVSASVAARIAFVQRPHQLALPCVLILRYLRELQRRVG